MTQGATEAAASSFIEYERPEHACGSDRSQLCSDERQSIGEVAEASWARSLRNGAVASVALRHFAPMGKRTFALGPNATPTQVAAALIADFKHGGTEPILCSIYRLAGWRDHWSFRGSIPVTVGARLNFPSAWCTEPSFHFTDLD